ncbi:Peptidase C13 family protein [Aphelenchoides fujianensis]|nr:Peptidase C13 family protein [Aphelenchoides fujianensis]
MTTRWTLCVFFLLLVSSCTADTWVVIVSGGSGFYNYALQSNAYHAYGVIRGHGVPAERVIMMAVDDLAFHEDNPFPGQIFNEANGPDVYAGVSFDYRGAEVTPANFHAILRGDRSAISGGSGRVLESTKDDHVFVYFVDHGDAGVICFPDDVVTAMELNDTLAYMSTKEMFGQLLIFVDSCYSGSMFDGILPSNANVYAMTAARADQLAFFTFCDLPVIRVCLATAFSHGWIVNSEESDPTVETLEQQFRAVSELVSGANVSDFGDRTIRSESIALFQGGQQIGTANGDHNLTKAAAYSQFTKDDLPIRFLESKLRDAQRPADRKSLKAEISEMKAKRAFHDDHTNSLVRLLVEDEKRAASIRREVPAKITQLDCQQTAIRAYHERCFNLGTNPYAQRAARVLTALCEDGHSTAAILKAIDGSCASSDPSSPTNIH